jgi:hypothetical protein
MLVNIIYFKPKVPRLIEPAVVVNTSMIGSPLINDHAVRPVGVLNTSQIGSPTARVSKRYVRPTRVTNTSVVGSKELSIAGKLTQSRVVNVSQIGSPTVRVSKRFVRPTQVVNTSQVHANSLVASTPGVLSFDGTAVVNQGLSGATSGAITLSTTLPDNIIVVMVTLEDWPNPAPTVTSITDTAGLTWARRSFKEQTSSINRVEVWWAHAAAVLTSDVITVHTDFFDDATITGFAVNGANLSDPWDTNGSLPASATGGGNDPHVDGVSTTAPDTFVFGFAGDAQIVQFSGGAGAGATTIATPHNNGRNNWSNGMSQYQQFATPQSGITVATATVVSNIDWVMIADAIRQAT